MIPDLQDIGASYNVLPHGRYKASFDEIQSVFAPNDNPRRSTIWSEFVNATQMLQKSLGNVHSVWIGGSFITSKEDPSDIDVTYVIKHDTYQQATGNAYGVASLSILQGIGARPQAFEHIDLYLIVMPPTELGSNEPVWYMQTRGYWDQHWAKTRYDNDNGCPYPQRGYLEVIIDGDR